MACRHVCSLRKDLKNLHFEKDVEFLLQCVGPLRIDVLSIEFEGLLDRTGNLDAKLVNFPLSKLFTLNTLGFFDVRMPSLFDFLSELVGLADEASTPLKSSAFEESIASCIFGDGGGITVADDCERFPCLCPIRPSNLEFNRTSSVSVTEDARHLVVSFSFVV